MAILFWCGVAFASAGATRHYAPNGNFDESGHFTPGAAGFDIADVSSVAALDGLPPNVKGLLWVERCVGVDENFRALAASAIDHPKLFGFYLADDPDPTGRWKKTCLPESLRAEADWIHARRSDALTFVALMNIGSSSAPAYERSLGPETTHVDLFGIAPYPCRTEWAQCDFDMIGRFVEAAARAKIPRSAMVPIFQTFGGGAWRTDSGGSFRMPDSDEMKRMLDVWAKLMPTPLFDMAYSWGTQRSDVGLSASPLLQSVLKEHNSK